MPTENTGETASFDEGGTESGAFDFHGGASWAEIRELIARCEELPDSVRKAMIEDGDLAVGRVAEGRLMQ